MRVLASLGAVGVTGSGIAFHAILQNSVGFNRLIWALTENHRNKKFPSVDMVGKVSDKVVNENAYSLINQVQNSPKDLRAVYNKLEEIKKEL